MLVSVARKRNYFSHIFFLVFIIFDFHSLVSSLLTTTPRFFAATKSYTNNHHQQQQQRIIMTAEASPLLAEKANGNNKNNDNDNGIHNRITNIRQLMQDTHTSRINFSYEWRKEQLTIMKTLVKDHWEEIMDVLYTDLGKVRSEAACFEMGALEMEIDYLLNNVKRFMKSRDVPSPGSLFPAFSKITPMPLNGPAVLVIGPSNYPISISLMAVAGSLAAGNPTVLKPSELCPASSTFLSKYITKYYDPSTLQVIEGSVKETTALLEYDWGLIHFTGSERVGKIVAKAAAKTLTPIVLELGGKGPCFVDETCPSDIRQVANRIIWAKLVNAGQNCISPDYLVVHTSQVNALLPELVRAVKEQFGDDPEQSGLAKLVSSNHVKRAMELLEEVEERSKSKKSIEILCGGSKKCNPDTGYVAPTCIVNAPMNCRIMEEELFCPILPILVVESRNEAVKLINSIPGTPLGLYIFTTSESIFRELTERCRSGTAVRNDSLIQFAGPHLPFGGLGSSGYGRYRGESSLEVFSHMLPSVYRPCAPLMDMKMLRYQPFATWKSFALEKVVPVLPHIPVMKPFRRAAMISILAFAIVKFVPGADAFVRPVRLGLAEFLRNAANALSP